MYRTSTTRWRDGLRTAIAAALLVLAACSRDSVERHAEQRGVDAFHSIELRGAIDASVVAGSAGSVTLVADADALRATRTQGQNGKLIVEAEPGLHWLRGAAAIEVRITLPQLNALTMNGAGNVVIAGVDSPALALELQGAGKLAVSGKTEALNARVNGAGNMDLSRLVVREASAAVNGAGSLDVNVTGSLQAEVNGVGSIRYAGKPLQVNSQIHGVGRIIAAPAPGS